MGFWNEGEEVAQVGSEQATSRVSERSVLGDRTWRGAPMAIVQPGLGHSRAQGCQNSTAFERHCLCWNHDLRSLLTLQGSEPRTSRLGPQLCPGWGMGFPLEWWMLWTWVEVEAAQHCECPKSRELLTLIGPWHTVRLLPQSRT